MIAVTDAFYWGDGRVAWIADGRMFTCPATTPWAVYLIERGLVRHAA